METLATRPVFHVGEFRAKISGRFEGANYANDYERNFRFPLPPPCRRHRGIFVCSAWRTTDEKIDRKPRDGRRGSRGWEPLIRITIGYVSRGSIL